MIVEIKDDFDLYKIAFSGQIFRAYELGNGWFRFFRRADVLDIRRVQNNTGEGTTLYEVKCSDEDWENIWYCYFDLDRDYSKVRSGVKDNKYLAEACVFGEGIRILLQDPWEMLVSFIISQRKNIPAIRTSIEALCKKFGELRTIPYGGNESYYTFPTAEKLAELNESDLDGLGLGYRTPYVLDAAKQVASGKLNLNLINQFCDEDLFAALKMIHGVGDKVANCVMLFGYHRTGRAPVDVWIQRIIDEEFDGRNAFLNYGENAGIIQQYAFYFASASKRKK